MRISDWSSDVCSSDLNHIVAVPLCLQRWNLFVHLVSHFKQHAHITSSKWRDGSVLVQRHLGCLQLGKHPTNIRNAGADAGKRGIHFEELPTVCLSPLNFVTLVQGLDPLDRKSTRLNSS